MFDVGLATRVSFFFFLFGGELDEIRKGEASGKTKGCRGIIPEYGAGAVGKAWLSFIRVEARTTFIEFKSSVSWHAAFQ